MSDLFYILYAHCIPVKGASRSVICNLQSGSYYFIPNDMFIVINENRVFNVSSLVTIWGEDNRESLESYIDLLVTNKSVFSVSNPKVLDYFPPISLDFDSPSIIDNAIIDFSNDFSSFNYFLPQLFFLGCRAILIRFLDKLVISKLEMILRIFDDSPIQHIDIVVANSSNFTDEELNIFFTKYLRLSSINLFDCKDTGISVVKMHENNSDILGVIRRNKFKYDPLSHCPSISADNFVINLPHFSESLHFNNCLNKKISIDIEGNVRNCPSMEFIFGNVFSDTLISIINNSSFKILWDISKDQIEVCKDCEFRYICSDCRASTDSDNNFLSKPKLCNYDPYSAKWID